MDDLKGYEYLSKYWVAELKRILGNKLNGGFIGKTSYVVERAVVYFYRQVEGIQNAVFIYTLRRASHRQVFIDKLIGVDRKYL